MKPLKYTVLLLALCAGMTSLANATLTDLGAFKPANENPATVQAFFQAQTGLTSAIDCLRVGGQASGTSFTGTTSLGGTITVDFVATGPGGSQQASVTFDLTGTGQVICGFFVFGGSLGGELFTVSADEGVTGTFTINTPLNPANGQFFDISHIDIFCCPAGVPDGGPTLMLLGAALTGLGLMRRYLKH
jgi:VPDSG-CTERM motif